LTLRVLCALLLWFALSGHAAAVEFRSVLEPAATLYDAPSTRASKLLILSAGYPVEVVVAIEGWVKVRDEQGTLAWAEAGRLSAKRTILAHLPIEVRDSAADNARVVFRTEAGVALELIEQSGAWVKVRHRDGDTGYARVTGFWGL
jgi:SH3-like domain-containing protein